MERPSTWRQSSLPAHGVMRRLMCMRWPPSSTNAPPGGPHGGSSTMLSRSADMSVYGGWVCVLWGSRPISSLLTGSLHADQHDSPGDLLVRIYNSLCGFADHRSSGHQGCQTCNGCIFLRASAPPHSQVLGTGACAAPSRVSHNSAGHLTPFLWHVSLTGDISAVKLWLRKQGAAAGSPRAPKLL